MAFLAMLCLRRQDVNVSLTPELEQLINDKVETGSYQTASEVVREALRLLKHRDEGLVALRRDIQAGLDQAARGEYTQHDRQSLAKLAARVKARGRKRLAALKAPKHGAGR
jgi:antitoxin ParD1/3/4